jgi:hypothetical protein
MRKTRILEVIYFNFVTEIFQGDDKSRWNVRRNMLSSYERTCYS